MIKPLNLPSKYIFIGFITIIIISFAFLGLFLYNNFYLALSGGKTTHLSGPDITLEKINSDLFNKIVADINKKTNSVPVDLNNIKDPFSYY